jgi:hypothetical protein
MMGEPHAGQVAKWPYSGGVDKAETAPAPDEGPSPLPRNLSGTVGVCTIGFSRSRANSTARRRNSGG